MKLFVARRMCAWSPEDQLDWWPNPEWINAPHELVQIPSDTRVPPISGPFRFKAQDLAQAEQFALEQNWDALQKLAVPERIPPTHNKP